MIVIYKGEEISINEDLLQEIKVEHNLMDIIKVRYEIKKLFEAEKTGMLLDMEQEVMVTLRTYEKTLQLLWGFPEDESYYTRQFELLRCLCPLTDNRERAGTGSFIINSDCPYHGLL